MNEIYSDPVKFKLVLAFLLTLVQVALWSAYFNNKKEKNVWIGIGIVEVLRFMLIWDYVWYILGEVSFAISAMLGFSCVSLLLGAAFYHVMNLIFKEKKSVVKAV